MTPHPVSTPDHDHEPMDAAPPPASPDEVAALLGLLRATVATVLTYRKDFRMRITAKQRERAAGVLVRVAMTSDGTIETWLEPPVDGMRQGVPYLGPLHPSRNQEPTP